MDKTFAPIESVARRLGVPAAWLKAEADAGHVPYLKTGRRMLMNEAAVQTALLERAQLMTAAEEARR